MQQGTRGLGIMKNWVVISPVELAHPFQRWFFFCNHWSVAPRSCPSSPADFVLSGVVPPNCLPLWQFEACEFRGSGMVVWTHRGLKGPGYSIPWLLRSPPWYIESVHAEWRRHAQFRPWIRATGKNRSIIVIIIVNTVWTSKTLSGLVLGTSILTTRHWWITILTSGQEIFSLTLKHWY